MSKGFSRTFFLGGEVLLLCDQVPLNREINCAKLSIYHYIYMMQNNWQKNLKFEIC